MTCKNIERASEETLYWAGFTVAEIRDVLFMLGWVSKKKNIM